jgi:hypothetical protein
LLEERLFHGDGLEPAAADIDEERGAGFCEGGGDAAASLK